MLIPLGFFFGFFLNITTLVLIQLYLGTGILVETIVVVDILVGFFSQLSRLCCWCDYSVLFLYIKCFGFSLLRPKFLLSCGWNDVAWSVDCGIVVISLFCGSFLAEIFIRKKITSTGALWESRVRYISFFHFSPMDLCQK